MALTPTIAEEWPKDTPFRSFLVRSIRSTCRHWLLIGNVGMILFATLPVLAPILAALGFEGISLLIFQVYSLTCHQMPDRSYFLFGRQMAYCERNTAIYGTMALASLAYAGLRRKGLPTLSLLWYAVLILPIAVDGFSQLFGWRESTWLLRGLTGSLFGLATIWLCFPRLQESFDEIERELS